jgi:hypothetical protein
LYETFVTANFKQLRRKQLWPVSRQHSFGGTAEKRRKPGRISIVSAEIQTEHLPDMSEVLLLG